PRGRPGPAGGLLRGARRGGEGAARGAHGERGQPPPAWRGHLGPGGPRRGRADLPPPGGTHRRPAGPPPPLLSDPCGPHSSPPRRGGDVRPDDRRDHPEVDVVNERLAERYWPGEDAIGKRLTLDDAGQNPVWLTVVGIVKDTVRSDWAAAPDAELYIPYLQG